MGVRLRRLSWASGGLGSRVWGLGFRVWGLGLWVWGLGSRVEANLLCGAVPESRLHASAQPLDAIPPRLRVASGLEFRVWGLGFRV